MADIANEPLFVCVLYYILYAVVISAPLKTEWTPCLNMTITITSIGFSPQNHFLRAGVVVCGTKA